MSLWAWGQGQLVASWHDRALQSCRLSSCPLFFLPHSPIVCLSQSSPSLPSSAKSSSPFVEPISITPPPPIRPSASSSHQQHHCPSLGTDPSGDFTSHPPLARSALPFAVFYHGGNVFFLPSYRAAVALCSHPSLYRELPRKRIRTTMTSFYFS